jgi:hypothetical protein
MDQANKEDNKRKDLDQANKEDTAGKSGVRGWQFGELGRLAGAAGVGVR